MTTKGSPGGTTKGVAERDEAPAAGGDGRVGGRPGGTAAPGLPGGLDFAADREAAPPRPASTIIIVRHGTPGLEVFCVQRHQGIAFMGGAVVFPGGKLDPGDHDPAIATSSDPDPRGAALVDGDFLDPAVRDVLRGLAVAACRESIEEAAIVPAHRRDGAVLDAAGALDLRAALESGISLAEALAARDASLDLAALVPFARWVTPEAERRRYDARFFLLRLPDGQEGRHDGKETTRGFWDSPAGVLARFAAGEVQLAPPTTRCLELLRGAGTVAEATAVARAQSLLPVCPLFLPGDPPVLALPGDPAHPVPETRVHGPTRFVLRDGRFVGEDAPA